MSAVVLASALEQALAHVAAALRTPVLVLALVALLACALETGRFAIECWRRARAGRRLLATLVAQALAEPARAATIAARAPSPLVADALERLAYAATSHGSRAGEHALAEYELAVQRRLERTRILVRAGPALGLMGTLIPLAPGLAALGRGDVGTLAGDLRTAFAATTVGLLVGTVAFALTLVRTRMYGEDLTALERGLEARGDGPASARVANDGALAPTAAPPW